MPVSSCASGGGSKLALIDVLDTGHVSVSGHAHAGQCLCPDMSGHTGHVSGHIVRAHAHAHGHMIFCLIWVFVLQLLACFATTRELCNYSRAACNYSRASCASNIMAQLSAIRPAPLAPKPSAVFLRHCTVLQGSSTQGNSYLVHCDVEGCTFGAPANSSAAKWPCTKKDLSHRVVASCWRVVARHASSCKARE